MILRDTKETFKIVKTELKSGTPYHSIIDLEDINFQGKSVVCFCGNLTKKPENAVSYSAKAYTWLSDYPDRDNVTFYSIYYPTEQPLESNLSPNIALDYRHLSKKLLMSAVRKNNEPLPVNEMIKNLSNITFFGHSAGGMVMDETIDRFIVFLKRYSFNKESINKILSSIVFVGYAPYKFVEAPINAVYITPFFDSLGSSKKAIERINQEKNFISSNENCKQINSKAVNCQTYEDFVKMYQPILTKDKSIYFANNNTLFAMPDLLIDDGIIEDHNLAGVSESYVSNASKTQAGIITTSFMHNVFKQSLQNERKNFSTIDLFDIDLFDAETFQNSENIKQPDEDI